MIMEFSRMTDMDLEDFANQVKDSICQAMIKDNTLVDAVAMDWACQHIIIIRAPNKVSRLIKKVLGKEDSKYIMATKVVSPGWE